MRQKRPKEGTLYWEVDRLNKLGWSVGRMSCVLHKKPNNIRQVLWQIRHRHEYLQAKRIDYHLKQILNENQTNSQPQLR